MLYCTLPPSSHQGESGSNSFSVICLEIVIKTGIILHYLVAVQCNALIHSRQTAGCMQSMKLEYRLKKTCKKTCFFIVFIFVDMCN